MARTIGVGTISPEAQKLIDITRQSFFEGMKFADKAMCKMYVKMLSKKDPSEIKAWEKPFFEAKDKKCDWTDKKYIGPLIETVKGKGE